MAVSFFFRYRSIRFAQVRERVSFSLQNSTWRFTHETRNHSEHAIEESKLNPSFIMSCSTKVMRSHWYSLTMKNLLPLPRTAGHLEAQNRTHVSNLRVRGGGVTINPNLFLFPGTRSSWWCTTRPPGSTPAPAPSCVVVFTFTRGIYCLSICVSFSFQVPSHPSGAQCDHLGRHEHRHPARRTGRR